MGTLCGPTATANEVTPINSPQLRLEMVPGIWITGDVAEYIIEYTEDVPPVWKTLTTIRLNTSPFFFADTSATNTAKRVYRAVRKTPNAPEGMVLILGGTFQMGDLSNDELGVLEVPVHEVALDSFYMDSCETSKILWDEVYTWALQHGYAFANSGNAKGQDHPVQSVNWYDAVKWCNARSEMGGRPPAYYTDAGHTAVYRIGESDLQSDWVNLNGGFRLPTEAEWEYAARGGLTAKRFPWGDTVSHAECNYLGTPTYNFDLSTLKSYHPEYAIGSYPYTNPVQSLPRNAFGLFNMAGNVWEWCWDRFNTYASTPQVNPTGLSSGAERVLRGGAWSLDASYSRVACRVGLSPLKFNNRVGFRCVLR